MAITLRQESNPQATTKGSALTFTELDNNFIHVLSNGIIVVGDDSTGTEFTLGNTLTVAGGTGITTAVSGNTLTITSSVTSGLNDIVEDTTPQLGGNLDINAKKIVSTSNGDIEMDADGTGTVKVTNTHTFGGGYDNLYPGHALTLSDSGSGAEIIIDQYLQESPAPAIQYFTIYYDTTGTYTYPAGTSGDVANFIGYDFDSNVCRWTAQGGDLILSALGTSNDSYASKNIQFDSVMQANQEIEIKKTYKETVTTLTDDSTTDIHIDCSASTVSTFSLNDSKTFVFANLDEGRSHTLIITNQGAHTATLQGSDSSAVKFPGGAPTITATAGAIDVITVFYDGTNYLGNIAQNYS